MLRYDVIDALLVPSLGESYPVLSVIGICDISDFRWHFWAIHDLDSENEAGKFNPLGYIRTDPASHSILALKAACDWIEASLIPEGFDVDYIDYYGDNNRSGYNAQTRPISEGGLCDEKDMENISAYPIIIHYEPILRQHLKSHRE